MARPEQIEKFADEIERLAQDDKKDEWNNKALRAYEDVIWQGNTNAEQTMHDMHPKIKELLKGMTVERLVMILRGVAGTQRAKMERVLNDPTKIGDGGTEIQQWRDNGYELLPAISDSVTNL